MNEKSRKISTTLKYAQDNKLNLTEYKLECTKRWVYVLKEIKHRADKYKSKEGIKRYFRRNVNM